MIARLVRVWRLRSSRRAAADVDRLLMQLQQTRAEAISAAAVDVLVPLDAVIASLTRVRMGMAEGRVRDMKLEVAAINAADEQIRAIGGIYAGDA